MQPGVGVESDIRMRIWYLRDQMKENKQPKGMAYSKFRSIGIYASRKLVQ